MKWKLLYDYFWDIKDTYKSKTDNFSVHYVKKKDKCLKCENKKNIGDPSSSYTLKQIIPFFNYAYKFVHKR